MVAQKMWVGLFMSSFAAFALSQSVSISYHGNAFSQQPLNDRFERINHLGSFESPTLPHYQHEFIPAAASGTLVPKPDDECGLHKVGFSQDLQHQYVQYKANMPDLKEFTLCLWTKFHNHSTDHPLFNYAVGEQPKEISSWVSNTERASYYSMSVAGHTFYRLNYPLKPNTWYHSCQSWNGRTGEWQIWVDGERVGRGFYNRLVGHVVKGGGIAITGQDKTQAENGVFVDAKSGRRGIDGMLGEFTMLQLYHVALTAGKAHKDHKHHHVHHFAHDGSPLPLSIPPPPPPQSIAGPGNSVFVGGQLTPMLELNLGNRPQNIPAQLSNGLQINQQFVNGQFGPGRIISEQLFNSRGPVAQQPQQFGGSLGQFGQLSNPGNVQFYDGPFGDRFRRSDEVLRNKRDNPEKDLEVIPQAKKQSKRGLVALSDGSIVDDSLLGGETFEQSLLNGLAGLGENIPVQNIQKEKVDEREPAEAEVRAVMDLCNGCAPEPFQKALVLSWRHSPKNLFNGAYYYPSVPVCKSF